MKIKIVIIKILSILLFFLATCDSCFRIDKTNGKLYLEIEPVKRVQSPDNVKVKIKFINKSNQTVDIYVCQRLPEKTITQAIDILLFFKIETADKKLIYNYEGIQVILPHKIDFVSLERNYIFEEIIKLNDFYGLEKYPENREWPKGEYEISCVYQYQHKSVYTYGENLWEGKLESDTIKIEVK